MSIDAFSRIANPVYHRFTYLDACGEEKIVCLDRDRLYIELDKFLHVHVINRLRSPIAAYPLNGHFSSCLVDGNRLYLNAGETLHVFEVSTSLTQPLLEVSQIPVPEKVNKIVKSGYKLFLAMSGGTLSVLDSLTCVFIHSH